MLKVFIATARFCQFKYYRDIAAFMRIKVPLLNAEIQLEPQQECRVHGLKLVEKDASIEAAESVAIEDKKENMVENIAIQTNQQVGSVKEADSKSSASYEDIPQYIFDKSAETTLPFSQALKLSSSLQLDLSLMKLPTATAFPVLSVSPLRRHIYTEYYLRYICKKGNNNQKGVRLGDKIEPNDIRTKVENVKRLVKAGERKFKLTSVTDSEKSQKVLIEFARIFGKEVQPELQTVKAKPGKKEYQRWTATLVFDDPIEVDFDKVNKKWRRRALEQQEALKDNSEEEMANFSDDKLEIQREMYETYKELGMKMPPRYQAIAKMQEELHSDRLAIYKSAVQDQEGVQADLEGEWDSQEQEKFQQKTRKYNEQHFKERSVEDIVTEMQELKRSGYESEGHKVARYRKLKSQLEKILKKGADI